MPRDDYRLGLESAITRRDFVNGAAVAGLGSVLTGVASDADASRARSLDKRWTGPGGVGDYALSNGNTHDVVNAAHAVRDGRFDTPPDLDSSDVEDHDLIVIGGGITGLLCGWEHLKKLGSNARCLILDNHRMFGGEARGNRIDLDGVRLEGPQGSNAFAVLGGGLPREYWDELSIPTDFSFGEPRNASPALRVPLEHYGPQLWLADSTSVGYRRPGRDSSASPVAAWARSLWHGDEAGSPFPVEQTAALRRWRECETLKTPPGVDQPPDGGDLFAWRQATEQTGVARWLDSMTYADYLERVLGAPREVTRFVDPIVAVGLSGTSADAVSAYAAQRILLPGVTPFRFQRTYESLGTMAAPSGNALFARYILRSLIPAALVGEPTLQNVLHAPVNLDALDRPENLVRLRLAATAVRVEHEGSPSSSERVIVTYTAHGRVRVARGRAVVMAGGGWMNRHVVRDQPESLRAAYASFRHGPVLVVNIALRNWRFMDRLGISAARWFEGFGFFGTFVRPMRIGPQDPLLDPNRPVMFTMYVPFLSPGLPAAAQCAAGRAQLFAGSFSEFERRVRQQMQLLFGSAGFDARRDIGGIILNRWGHAYICAEPGFFFGTGGSPAARDIVRAGYGRIRFAHAELQGNQSILSSMVEAKRASEQVARWL
jgi:spermidine dehydrogenase